MICSPPRRLRSVNKHPPCQERLILAAAAAVTMNLGESTCRYMLRKTCLIASMPVTSLNGSDPKVAVTYLLNKLQPLPVTTPLLLPLNPLGEPRLAA
jgi:hypothetical protein